MTDTVHVEQWSAPRPPHPGAPSGRHLRQQRKENVHHAHHYAGRAAGGCAAVRKQAVAAAAAATLAAYACHAAGTTAAPGHLAAAAVAYAREQLGKPYVSGAAGPDAFDCSGLTWAAYTSAGVNMGPRSDAAQQWASEPHVSAPQPGDLVFFAGADGSPASPGHVGIVTSPATHTMIDAYATGTGVRYDTYGLPGSAPGLSDPVGFTRPAGS